MYLYIYIHIHTHAQTHTHTYIHTHTRACIQEDAPLRRLTADRLPDLQPQVCWRGTKSFDQSLLSGCFPHIWLFFDPIVRAQINHALLYPQLVPRSVAAYIHEMHYSKYTEPVIETERDLLFQAVIIQRRPDPSNLEPLVPYPDVHSMPRQNIEITVRGPPNARVWGKWQLDKNCHGIFQGLTCALVRDLEYVHVEYRTFTILCIGGPWEMEHVDIRAGGPAGALILYDTSRMDLRWCGVGGIDDGEFRCQEGIVVKDASMCNVTSSFLEFCGGALADCGVAISMQNQAILRVNASVFQHNYNHIQIMNHPIVRSGNCTFWNHSYALWLAYETATEGSQLALEHARIYGPVWRNEWRPNILVEVNNQRFSRHLTPDAPASSTSTTTRVNPRVRTAAMAAATEAAERAAAAADAAEAAFE